MMAVSVQQPAASLIVHGYKKLVVRRYSTQRREPLLIHASLMPPDSTAPQIMGEIAAMLEKAHGPDAVKRFQRRMGIAQGSGFNCSKMYRGGIVGQARVVELFKARTCRPDTMERITDEWDCGWAWGLLDPKYFVEPLGWRGHRTLMAVPDDLASLAVVKDAEPW